MLSKILIILICALCFRIRGGLDMPFTKKNFPLNKWWFAVSFSLCACYLKGFTWNYFLIMLIASRLATQLCGWGEYKGCDLGAGKPDPNRHDMFEVDEFLGANKGLVMAEVELQSEDEPFKKPDFIGKEVTGDRRFYNGHLRKFPFCIWGSTITED